MELEELIYLRPECPSCQRKMKFLYADSEEAIFNCPRCRRSYRYRIVEEKLIRVD